MQYLWIVNVAINAKHARFALHLMQFAQQFKKLAIKKAPYKGLPTSHIIHSIYSDYTNPGKGIGFCITSLFLLSVSSR